MPRDFFPTRHGVLGYGAIYLNTADDGRQRVVGRRQRCPLPINLDNREGFTDGVAEIVARFFQADQF